MARTGTLGGGTLNPFGGWSVDFGAFNIGESDAAKTVSAQEQAALQFAVQREQHDAGLMSDAEFMAIQQQYLSGLDPKTTAGATAQYTLLMAQYTNDRNALAQAVQAGNASPKDLLAFDQAALGQVVPGSLEYYQRQDRYWSSQTMVFQQDEREILTNLQAGRITNQQAQDWYAAQAGSYTDNASISEDIQGKIVQFADRIVAEQDQAFAESWNKGNLTIAQVIAYTTKAQQDDPNSARARNLQEFAQSARLQAQEASFKYRYDLTREYAQLTKVIASAKESMATGHTTELKGTTTARSLWDGSKWVVVTSTTGAGTKYVAPTAKQVEANKQRLADIENAKKRQAEISRIVGNIAGGWVTDQDYIRNLTAQQALTQTGSPAWYALQQQIDGHNQRIEADKILAQSGIRVAYPSVKSETQADLSVPWYERPVGTGLSSAQLKQVQGWNAQIVKLQEAIASGTLTEEQLTQANADIAKNQSYINNTLKDADKPSSTTVAKTTPAKAVAAAKTSSPSGGGGTAGARSPSSPTAIGTTKTNSGAFGPPTPKSNAPLQRLVSEKVSTGWQYGEQFRTIQTKGATLPKGMSASAFDDFHHDFVDAIKNGQATFEDKTTGAVYAIPLKPEERLAMMRFLDDRNVELKATNLQMALAKPNVSQNYIDDKKSALRTAERNAATNILWILDTRNPGTVVDSKGKAIKLVESEAGVEKTNPIAYGNDLLDVTMSHAQRHFDIADQLFEKGDMTGAAAEIAEGRRVIDRVATGPNGGAKGSLLDLYATRALQAREEATALGAKVPGEIDKDITRLLNFDTELAGVTKSAAKTATTLFGPPDKPGTGILKMSNGLVQLDPSGQVQLNEGYALYVDRDGTNVEVKKAKVVGTQNGKPLYGDTGRVNVFVKVNGANQPMLAEYTVGRVGEMTIDGKPIDVLGKMVMVGEEVWVENPWRAGMWVPLNGTKDIKYTVPAGATFVNNGEGKVKIPGIANGTPLITYKKDGETFFLMADEATGTFRLWAGTQQGLVERGTSGTALGTPNQDFINSTSDFTYDQSTLGPEQRSIVNLVSSGINSQGGAWIGSSSRDIANYFLRPGLQDPPGVRWTGDTISEKVGMRLPAYQPATPEYAPESSYNAPIQSEYLASILPSGPTYNAPIQSAYLASILPPSAGGTAKPAATTPKTTTTASSKPATTFTSPPKPAAKPVGTSIPSTQRAPTNTRVAVEPVGNQVPTIKPPPTLKPTTTRVVAS